MPGTGLCCSDLEEPQALMKMGLTMVLIGHVNFLLGALVHGVVLRHINLHKQARAMEYAISNVVALTSGLLGVVVGILAIVLSKNKKKRGLTWSLFTFSLAASVTAAASAVGLLVSMVRAIIHGGKSLLTHCRFPDAIGYSSITNECPFDPTRIYSTTLILWLPLIVTCVTQMVFSAQCLAVCVRFLGLPCCPSGRTHKRHGRAIRRIEAAPSRYTEQPRSNTEPPTRNTEAPTLRAAPPRQQHHHQHHHQKQHYQQQHYQQQHRAPPPSQNPPRHYRSLPPPERRPLYQPYAERSNRERTEKRPSGQQTAPEEHQLLERGTLERNSFWI
ncbi:transmembrane protein 54-like [Cynoglossus semilaevis]|uniref:Transmembrane protein 54b n=1 Tax=Cynoglossus semilaevis TaxID=244447 RepID=A0A3P8W1F4_CYNSE|nr:transmembrane protein 54-like [Cynoglossus semilaevis]